MKSLCTRLVKAIARVRALATCSEDNWSWSMHGNLIMACTAMEDQQQPAHSSVNLCTMVEVTSGKVSVHKRHSYTPETQLMIWAWSLLHANVAAMHQTFISALVGCNPTFKSRYKAGTRPSVFREGRVTPDYPGTAMHDIYDHAVNGCACRGSLTWCVTSVM